MKKILVINTAGLAVGGITTHMINYLTELIQNYSNVNITIVSSMLKDEKVVNQFKNIGCNVIFLANRKKSLLKYLRQLDNLIKSEKFDVIHVHGNSPTMGFELSIAKKNRIPIRIAHCHNSICTHPMIYKVLNPLFQSSYTDAIACNNAAGNWLYGKGNFEVLYNSVDVDKFRYNPQIRESYRKRLGLKKDTLVIGMVGNINEQKNPMFLVNILKNIVSKRNILFLVIGEGPLLKDMKIQLNDIKQSVLFLDFKFDINNWFQAMDLLVMPSLWEGLPMTLIEAQDSGLSCLTSNNVSLEANLNSKTFTELPLDSKKWEQYIVSFANNYDRKYSYKTIEKSPYNIKNSISKLVKIYKLNM